MLLAPGSRIGRYTVIERLGAGGMGVVFSARDDLLDRTVALKLLPPEFATDPERLRRFEREARATGRLQHPHIVSIFDAVLEGDQPYLVTELVEGETLAARLLRGALPVEQALRLARQVALALDAAHALGVVHRDLKPANIILTPDGTAKVLDFGLAKIATDPALDDTRLSATAPGVLLGTAAYMSPEQIQGRPVDRRSDVFSLGIVLYEALSGRQPFARGGLVETLHAIVHDAPPQLPPHVPMPLRHVVERCLQKDPGRRFQSARDLDLELEPLEPSNRQSLRRGALASKRGTGVLIVAILALLLLAAAVTRLRPPAGAPAQEISIRAIAVLPLEDLSRDKDQEYLADSLTEALIMDLSQIRALRVIGRTSVMRYKGSKQSVQEISRELGVNGVVAGTVLRVGDRVRVSANLMDARTERHLWGEQYDREIGDVLALQTELAGTIARRVSVQLTRAERARLAPTAGTSTATTPAGHEQYLRGKYFWNKRDPASLQLALDAFRKATELDPGSARAWAGLADTYFYMGYAFGRMPPIEAMPKARDAAQRALALDAGAADAHTALGLVHLFFDWDRGAAEAELRQALILNPGYVLAHRSMAALSLVSRRWNAAIEHARAAVHLDPVSVAEHYFLGLAYLDAGRLDEADQVVRRLLELEPRYSLALSLRANVLEGRGDLEAAVEQLLELGRLSGVPESELAERSRAYQAGGIKAYRTAEASASARSWDGWHFGALLIASQYAQAGNREATLTWLQKVKEARSAGIMLANADRAFEAYRSDRRFKAILGPGFTE